MIATQRLSASDNFAVSHKKNTKLKHLITHSRHREWLLSTLVRPAEVIVVLLSPLFFLARISLQLRDRIGQWTVGSRSRQE
jgi:hypothetical protein